MSKYDSFRAMQNSPEGFAKALYDTIAQKIIVHKSYSAMELDKDTVYAALYGVLATHVPDMKSYRAMQTTNLDGGIEEELYKAALKIGDGDYELVINKVSDLLSDSMAHYPNVYAVREALKLKAEKAHTHNISDVTNLENSLINNVKIIGNNLTSHDINVPLLTGEVIVNRLEPQVMLVDVGVLWVDCRKIRLKTTEKLVWILTATPTTEEPNKKTWVEYTGQSMFVQYEEGTPVFPEASSYNVGSILVDHKPSLMETYADIYINTLQDDNTTHYWRKMSSQDGYMKDPSKPSINGVNVAGARTSQSYKLQDQLEAGVNIKKIKVGDGEPQSLLDNPEQPLVVDGGGSGTSDYNSLVNLPEINETVLKGRLTSTDLKIPLTAEMGDCIIARNETYNPMLNIGTIWLDIFKIMNHDAAAAKILDWKAVGSKEKVWVDYDKVVHYEEKYDPDYVPHDIPDEQEGDICVVYNDNYVPVFWRVFKLDKVGGVLTWRRVNLIYSYSQIPDKPILNGHRIAGDKSLEHYGIQGKLIDSEGEDKNIAQLIIDGKKQSILQYNDIVINTGNTTDYIISRTKQDPDNFDEGFYWITYEEGHSTSGWVSYVREQLSTGKKVWTRYVDPLIAHEIPPINDMAISDGQLLVLDEDGVIEADDPVYKAVKNETVMEWVKLFSVLNYITLYDKPILNGHELIGNKTGRHYDLANLYRDTTPAEPEAGDFKVVQEKNPEDDYYHNNLTIYNSNLNAWEEIVQIYSNGKFNPRAEERFNTKQDQLFDSGSGQNIANLIVDGKKHSLLQRGNIVINRSTPEYIITEPDITLDPNEYPVGFFWITGLGTSAPDSNILQEVDGVKTWVRYRRPYAGGVFPEIEKSENGDLFLLTLDDIVSSDDHLYKVIKNATIQKWVELNREISYLILPDKPQIEGHELVGNKTADELGLATKEDITNTIQDTILIPKNERLPDVYQNYAVKESGDGKTPRTAVKTRKESYPLCPDGGTIMWMDNTYEPEDEINKNMTILLNPATERTLKFKKSTTVMFKVAAHKKFTIKGVNFELHDGSKYFFNELVVDNTTDNVINIDEDYINEHWEPVLRATSEGFSANNYQEYIILPDGDAEKIGEDTTDYNELEEDTLPQINNKVLKGNNSPADLGLANASDVATNFTKTSTTTSPNCKAIADYIDSLLSSLDGSEEAF